eukprot:CAMPEP_0174875320 /NCGR_PEP_ID=MMETSP1114-20130205/78166_1 /TAXON_ID=312471 /ORGANISM="Neobodo designis, Strain CCAP 1951/1" /LENGTH=536 /DNA_ID=CAMNT_0016110667 /DNA_START=30 /DNA_END=1637 /DNA_ORIENTATION=+
MSLSARPPTAKRAGSAAPRGRSIPATPPTTPGPRGGRVKPKSRGDQGELMEAVVAATGTNIDMATDTNLFGTTEFFNSRQKKKGAVFKATGKGMPSQPVLGITVDSLIHEMRAQHDRMVKLQSAAAAAADAVRIGKPRFGSSSTANSPRRASKVSAQLTNVAPNDFGAIADAAAASLNSSTLNIPRLLPVATAPKPPSHTSGPVLPPPRAQSQPAVKRRGSVAVRRESVTSTISRPDTPSGSGGRTSPHQKVPSKRLHFGQSSSAGVGRGIMEAAKAKYLQLIEATRRVNASIILQRWFRANRVTWQLRRQRRAEVRIARTFSRCIMKLIVKVRMNRKRRAAALAAAAEQAEKEFAAAATIQRYVRGMQARSLVPRMRVAVERHRRWLRWTESRAFAATTIAQWWIRAKYARKARRWQAIAVRHEFAFVRHQLRWHKHLREARAAAAITANVHAAAATAIQAAFRGHLVRSHRTVFFFLLKNRLPPVVCETAPKPLRAGETHQVGYREWMTSAAFADPLWIRKWDDMRRLPAHGTS